MKAKFCPVCGGTDLMMVTGGEVGKLKCKKCEYEGLFPEREIELKKQNA